MDAAINIAWGKMQTMDIDDNEQKENQKSTCLIKKTDNKQY